MNIIHRLEIIVKSLDQNSVNNSMFGYRLIDPPSWIDYHFSNGNFGGH